MVFDLSTGKVTTHEELPAGDDMDFLGGIGRSFKILAEYDVTDPFAPDSPLVVNVGCLTGTAFMTGLRTYFSGYSPLKRTLKGKPMAAWSAMSGSFGRKFLSTDIDDLVLIGAADKPLMLVIKQEGDGPEISLQPAPSEIVGARVPEKMAWLNETFNKPESRSFPAHFAVIGPAGEHWETNWYACIVGSTQEQVMSGEDKYRFAGRLGMGSILGSKNVLAIVAYAEQDVYPKGDERLKVINREIGRGGQSRGFRHPRNNDGLGGTGKNTKLLDAIGLLPFKNFEPRGENLAPPVYLETMRDADPFIVIDKNCFGCQIACHQDFYAAPEGGKDPDARVARRNHGPYLGRYEYEPMELAGPNLGILTPDENLEIARLCDDLGFDAISVYVVLAFLMDYNSRNGKQIAGGIQFGDAKGAAQVMEDIAYGRETLFGKGVKEISEEIGGKQFAMHSKGVEHSAYLGQTNPGYPFAIAGGHMSMRTFLLYATDPRCKPDSADYWIDQITNQGWKPIAKDLHGGCLFALSPPEQVAEGIESVYGVPMTSDRLLDATYRSHLLGFALEQKQGATLADYSMPDEIFVGERKGDLPGVSFLTRELFEEIRERVLERLRTDAARFGYGRYMGAS
jgi:aldehyde:ferredoxin oxidoreductase